MTGPPAATPSAPAIDLRAHMRPVGDQGRRGTCVAFAVTGAHELHRTGGTDQLPDDLSEETLYWGCKQVDGVSGPGTRLSAADLALQRWGQPLEELWPYDETRNDAAPDYAPPAEAIEPANCHRVSLRRSPVERDAIVAELNAGRPVIVALRIWDAFRRAIEQPLPAPDPNELLPTGHAISIVGHDPEKSAFLVRNSWGARWGENGHLWVREEFVQVLVGAWAVEVTLTTPATLAADAGPVLTEGE